MINFNYQWFKSIPVTHSVVERSMKICRTDENMAGKGGAIVWTDHALIYRLVPVHSVCHYLSN